MLQVKNSIVDTQNGGTALDVISKVSMTSVACTNVLSPTFITCTGSYNISTDASASTLTIGTQNADLSNWFNPDGTIDETNPDAMAALKGTGWNGTDIVGWAYTTNTATGDISINPVVTGSGSQGSSVLPNIPISITISKGGLITLSPTAQKLLTTLVSGGGSDTVALEIAKALSASISKGGSVTTLAVQVLGLLLSVSGGGNSNSTYFKGILGDSNLTAGGSTVTAADVEKLLGSILTAGGAVHTTPSPGYVKTSVTRGSGSTTLAITKGHSIAEYISANGLVDVTSSISKYLASNVTSGSTGILLDISKGTAVLVDCTAGGSSSFDSISIDKGILSLVSTGGDIISVSLGNFTDNNIVYVSLSSVAHSTSIVATVIAGSHKEFTTRVNT